MRSFPTTDFAGLPAIIDAFFEAQPSRPAVTRAAFGVAGPVIDQRAQMTNVAVGGRRGELCDARSASPHVRLLNDLEAMATSLPVPARRRADAAADAARPKPDGNIALIAAGTGSRRGGAASASPAATCRWPAKAGTPISRRAPIARLDFVRYLRGRYGRAELEHVLSGRGLLNLSDFTHLGGRCAADPAGAIPTSPAEVSTIALARHCATSASRRWTSFSAAYGAAAGNLALTADDHRRRLRRRRHRARASCRRFRTATFIHAFNDKGPMRPLLEAMPVSVILNAEAGLLGAAVYANAHEIGTAGLQTGRCASRAPDAARQ